MFDKYSLCYAKREILINLFNSLAKENHTFMSLTNKIAFGKSPQAQRPSKVLGSRQAQFTISRLAAISVQAMRDIRKLCLQKYLSSRNHHTSSLNIETHTCCS